MIRKSILAYTKKQKYYINKYKKTRLKYIYLYNIATTLKEKLFFAKKIQKLPKISISIRFKNRCWKTGKTKSFYRFFGLCRNILRSFAHLGILPGVIKASW